MIEIGLVGLRRDDVARRLASAGVRVFACDADGRAEPLAAAAVVIAMPHAVAVAQALRAPPRVVWLDLPTGFATELAIQDVWPELAPGDVIVDAGGGYARDGVRRAASLASAGIEFVDCYARRGAGDDALSLFLGGAPAAIGVVAPYANLIAGAAGWTHCGPPGSGYHAGMSIGTSDGNAA